MTSRTPQILGLVYGCWFDFLNKRYDSSVRFLNDQILYDAFFASKHQDFKDAIATLLLDEENRRKTLREEVIAHGLNSPKRHVVLLTKLKLEDPFVIKQHRRIQAQLTGIATETKNDTELYRQRADSLRSSPDPDERALIDLSLSQVGWC